MNDVRNLITQCRGRWLLGQVAPDHTMDKDHTGETQLAEHRVVGAIPQEVRGTW